MRVLCNLTWFAHITPFEANHQSHSCSRLRTSHPCGASPLLWTQLGVLQTLRSSAMLLTQAASLCGRCSSLVSSSMLAMAPLR